MAFPNRLLEDIRARVALADIVGKRVKLTRKGREHSGLCPFHNEKTPSFTVSEDKGFYHCFGCGAHGDVISFVMNTEGLSFPETVERLAGEAGLEVPVETPEARAEAKRRGDLYDVVEAACAWFEAQLHAPTSRQALDYLQGRGLQPETIKRFRLGYAPDGAGLAVALKAKGIEEAQLIEAGLLRRPDDGRAPYPFFRDRVMFPIADRRDRVIAFGGRLMGEAKAAKYVNSPDTPLFDKGRNLYNFGPARQASFESGTLVVTEGYMDVIALSQAGIQAAVAPLGTAMTEDQIKAVWRLAAEPVLCFDGDTAGQRAVGRAAERVLPLLEPGKSLRFALLPPGEDPDSLVTRQGAAAMRQILEAAQPLSEVIWRLEAGAGPVDTPERRADLQARLEKRVGEIGDATVREYYRSAVRDRLWASFRSGGGKRRGAAPAQGNPAAHLRNQLRGQNRRAQQAILAALINHPLLRDEFDEALEAVTFEPDLDNLRQQLQNLFAGSADLDLEAIRAHFTRGDVTSLLDGVLDKQVYVMAPFASPRADVEEARRGLGHLIGRRVHERLRHEVTELGRSAAASADEAGLAKALAAKQDAIESDRQLADIDE
ncbi:MAG: DNA primase [Alphaproteobacteria bacterium]|nr:DNA primase [Alphaproteobacteria bacterium]